MWTLSTLSVIASLLVAFIIGLIVMHLIKGQKKGISTEEYSALIKEKEELEKEVNKAKRSTEKASNEKNDWKQKFDNLQSSNLGGNTDLKDQIKGLKNNIISLEKDIDTAKAEKERADSRLNRLSDEHNKIKRKIKAERESYKSTKQELETAKKQNIQDAETIDTLNAKVESMKQSLEKQFQKMGEINELTSLNRRLKAKNAKLGIDIEYWEKKHYETHHELAALKKKAGIPI